MQSHYGGVTLHILCPPLHPCHETSFYLWLSLLVYEPVCDQFLAYGWLWRCEDVSFSRDIEKPANVNFGGNDHIIGIYRLHQG